MPSTIGHALAGVTVAWAADALAPDSKPSQERSSALTVAAAAIASAPDLDLVFDVHRTVTHSIGATILVAAVAATVAVITRAPVLRIATVCAAAHASHIFLDWLSVDRFPPYGLQALWPFSHEWFISGKDWFRQTDHTHALTRQGMRTNLLAVGQEVAILGPIAWGVWLVRVKALARFPSEVPSGDHAA
jgi:inner membrane protein